MTDREIKEACRLAEMAVADDDAHKGPSGTRYRDDVVDRARMSREPALARALLAVVAQRDEAANAAREVDWRARALTAEREVSRLSEICTRNAADLAERDDLLRRALAAEAALSKGRLAHLTELTETMGVYEHQVEMHAAQERARVVAFVDGKRGHCFGSPGCVGRHHEQYCQGYRDAAGEIGEAIEAGEHLRGGGAPVPWPSR